MKIVRNQLLFFIIILSAQYVRGQLDKSSPESVSRRFLIEAEKEEGKKIDSCFTLLNNYRSKEAYKLAHRYLKTFRTDRGKANACNALCVYFQKQGMIDSLQHYAFQILKLKNFSSRTIKYKFQLHAYNRIATSYIIKGLFEESKKWYLKGIDLAEKTNDTDLYYLHTFGLARTYQETGNYENALKLFNQCTKYRGDPELLYGSFINIGDIYNLMEDYENSIRYFEKALDFCIEYKDKKGIASVYLNLGAIYEKQNKLDKALDFYQKTIEISDTNGFNQSGELARASVGSIFMAQENYADAEIIISSGLELALKYGWLDRQLKIYEDLKQIALATKNYKKAFEFSTKHFSVKDSINRLQKDKEINTLEVKYKTLQKEKEIKLLQVENSNRSLELKNQKEAFKNLTLQQEITRKENENKLLSFQNTTDKTLKDNIILKKNQELKNAQLIIQQAETERQKSFKYIILIAFFILLIPVVGLLITYYQKVKAQSELTKKQEEINEEKISSLLKDQELKVIKASMEGQDNERKRIAQELHDSIGGNLAAIKLQLNAAKKNEAVLKGINAQIDDTYELVRDLSHNLIPKKFSKNNFCDVLEEYLNNIGGTSKLNTIFSAYPRKVIDLLDETLQIETFKIIQELVTNSIKHAKASTIELQLNLVANELNILFEDDGVGFEVNKRNEGIGFRNIRSRLHKISGTIDIDSRVKRGTIINIEITNVKNIKDDVQSDYS